VVLLRLLALQRSSAVGERRGLKVVTLLKNKSFVTQPPSFSMLQGRVVLVRQIVARIPVIQGAGTDVKALRPYLTSLSHETLLRLFVTVHYEGNGTLNLPEDY